MDGFVLWLLTIFLLIMVVLGLLIVFFEAIVDPAYTLIFKKPLYLYWYLNPKTITPVQRSILEKEFSFYNKLTPKKKVYFEHRLKSFISHYQFVGKEDLVISEEMKVLIGGTFVMLTFGMRDYLISLFDKIIIYPSVYFSTLNQDYHKGEFNPMMKAVVFSWEDFKLGQEIENDNIHLGLHEFSHVLHFHCLKSNDISATIFFDEFNEVVKYYKDKVLLKKLIEMDYFRAYAYENQFEFLSVLLEHYFETPEEFEKKLPDLFKTINVMLNHK